jgi:hypothetical protein
MWEREWKGALIPKGSLKNALVMIKEEERERSGRSEISARDLQKPAWEFKTVNSIKMTKC